jgi:hypothetical protein
VSPSFTRGLLLDGRLIDRTATRWLLALAVAAIGVLPPLLGRVIPDTAFLLFAAERVLDGARLYVDIIEVNPPLVVWLNLPVVVLARAVGVGPATVYQLSVAFLAMSSLLGARWALKLLPGGGDPRVRRVTLLALVIAVLPLARADYGEREHLAMLLGLPFLLLMAPRLEHGRVPPFGALAAGLAAGIGIALKPHFVLAALAREGVLAARTGRAYRPGWETIAVAVVGIAYLGIVALLAPEYATVVADLAGPYHRFLRNGFLLTALLGDGTALAITGLMVGSVLLAHARRPALWVTMLTGTAAFWASAVLQFKGWRYHFLPSMAFGLVLLAIAWYDAERPLAPWSRRLFAAIAFGVCALAVAQAVGESVYQAATAERAQWDPDPDMLALVSVVRERAAGRPVLVLSGNMASAWPLLSYAGAVPVLRYTHPWPVVAALQDALRDEAPLDLHGPEARGPLERAFVTDLIADIGARPPALIVELRPGPDRPPWGIRRIDWLAFLRTEPSLAAMLDEFELAGEVGQYRIYQRRSDRADRLIAVEAPTPRRDAAPDRIVPDVGSTMYAVILVGLVAWAWRREERLARSHGV